MMTMFRWPMMAVASAAFAMPAAGGSARAATPAGATLGAATEKTAPGADASLPQAPVKDATDAAADKTLSADDPQAVIVTASRREQTLATLAASASVFDAAHMQALGVKSFAELARYTPGVHFDYLTKDVAIRGLASSAGAGTTGIYIDDTPIQMRALDFNPNNTLPQVFDLARVEVLRGPQGTLFGAGSEGGAVRYITVQPGLTEYSGSARAEFAFTQDGAPSEEVGAAFGGPLVEGRLGLRLSAWRRHDGGWIDQVDSATGQTLKQNANAVDTTAMRGALAWAPTSRLLITPAVTYQNRDQHFYDQYWVALSDPGAGRFVSGTPDQMADKDRFVLPTLTIRYDFERMKLISNTSFFDRRESVNGYSGTLYDLSYFQQLLDPGQPGGPVDPAFNPCSVCRSDLFPLLTPGGINLPGLPGFRAKATIQNRQANYTQEVRLQSTDPNARVAWVVGAFFADNREHSTDASVDPNLPALAQYLFGETMDQIWGMGLLPGNIEYINDTISHDRQIAVFADASVSLTDKVKLTGGARYAATHFEFRNYSDGPENFGPAGGSGKQDERPLTPRVELAYQMNERSLLYASIAEGYRIGGANAPFPVAPCAADLVALGISSVPASYNSDNVVNYELGMRSRSLDRRLTTALSVFHAQWDSIQQANFLPSCGFQYTANLGSAVSDGFDLQTRVNVSEAFKLDLAIGYTDAHYSRTVRAGDAPGAPALVVKGDGLGGSRWTASVGGQYDFTAFDHRAFVRADYAYTEGDARPTPPRDPATSSFDPFLAPGPATHWTSARAGAAFAKYDLSLFVDNVFNAHPQLNLNHEDQYTQLLEASTFRPRTLGMTIAYRF